MKIRLLLFAFLTMISVSAKAQLAVGARAGFGFSSTSFVLEKGMERKVGVSPQLGIMLHYNLDLKFSVGPEINYYKFSESITFDSSLAPKSSDSRIRREDVTSTTEISYIQIPITGRASIGEKKYRATIALGPYIGFAVSGKWTNAPKINYYDDLEGKKQPGAPSLVASYNLNEDKMRKFDWGGIISGGIEYQLTPTDMIFAEGRLQLGFLNFYVTGKEDRDSFAQSSYLFPSASWRSGSLSFGYIRTIKLPKMNFGGNPDAKRAGQQKKSN